MLHLRDLLKSFSLCLKTIIGFISYTRLEVVLFFWGWRGKYRDATTLH